MMWRFWRWLNPLVWSSGFFWGCKLGRLMVEVRLAYEYRHLKHAPRRTREATRKATMHFAPERHELLKKMGIDHEE